MAYLIGIVLALTVAGFAHLTGLDRSRGFYPAVAIAVASYYVLFAAMAGSPQIVAVESLAMAAFAVTAALGFRRTPWIVVACLAAHGVFDAVHGDLVGNPAVPSWWPAFCLAYDGAAAAILAWILTRSKRARPIGA